MKLRKWGSSLVSIGVLFLFGTMSVPAYEPTTLTFESPIDRVDFNIVRESGYVFSIPMRNVHRTVIGELNPVEGNGGGGIGVRPVNGTNYLVPSFNGTATILQREDATPFGLHAFDMAEYSSIFADPFTMYASGYRVDGSVVSTNFNGDGFMNGFLSPPDFQQVTFDENWLALLRVELTVRRPGDSFPIGFCIDNIAVSRSPVMQSACSNTPLVMNYIGVFQVSSNLVEWVDLDPQPTPPFAPSVEEPVRFYRVRDE